VPSKNLVRNQNKFTKQKNLLDIKHQRYLNYFNIITISAITSIFTIIWSFFTDHIDFALLQTSLTIVAFFAIVLIYLCFRKMSEVERKIKGLRLV
jgi:amino acid transporter